MARSRDPLAGLLEQIEKVEKSLGKLNTQVEETGDEYNSIATKLAQAEAALLARQTAGLSTSYSKTQIEKYSKQLPGAERKQEGAVDRYEEAAKSLAKMRLELVETTQQMEKDRLKRNGAAAIASGIGSTLGAVANVATGKQSLGEGIGQAAGGIGTAAGGVAKMGSDLMAAGQMAASTFMGFAGQMSGFVEAFSPATVELFNLAIRDLTAVVGMALQPVMDAFTEVVKEVSSRLYPVAQALTPVFKVLAGVMLQVLTPALDTLAGVLQSLVPVFEVFAQIIKALTPLLRIGQTLMAGWVELITSLISSMMPSKDGVKGFVDGFAEAIQNLAGAVMKVVAFIARALGGTAFIDGMIKSLRGKMAEKKDATGLAAPTGAAFTSLTSFGQQVAAKAFMATGEDVKSKTTEEWLAKLAEDLSEIKGGKGDLQTFLVTQFEALAVAIAKAIYDRVPKDKIHSAGAEAASMVAVSGGTPTGLAGALLGKLIFGGR